MLFEKVAIEPELLISDEVVYLLHHDFGWFDGRFVADLPQNWMERARSISHTLPDGLKKKRLENLLQVQRLPICRLAINLQRDAAWAEQVEVAKRTQEIPAILCTEPKNLEGWFGEEDLDKYLDESKRRVGSLDIKALTTEDILAAVDTFLEANKQIALVNPNQWLLTQNYENKELFTKLFTRWKDYGGVRFLVIRSTRPDRKAKVEASWEREIGDLQRFLVSIGYNKDFKFIAVNDDFDRLHDRYLIGNRFGLKLGYGLEISVTKSHPWTLMQQSEHVIQERRFLKQDVRDEYPDHKAWIYRK